MYQIVFRPSARKQFAKLPRDVQKRLKNKIDSLQHDPRPQGVKKLAANEDLYRIRIGDYRIIYQIQDRQLVILLLKIGHRREIYQ